MGAGALLGVVLLPFMGVFPDIVSRNIAGARAAVDGLLGGDDDRATSADGYGVSLNGQP